MVEEGAAQASNTQEEERRFAEMIRPFLALYADIRFDNDSAKRRFGMSCGLKHQDKLIAFLAKGRLIVKLPSRRVEMLANDGHGERCRMGRGRIMKEWVVVGPDKQPEWPALLTEAIAFATEKRQNRS